MSRRINYDQIRGIRIKSYSKIVDRVLLVSYTLVPVKRARVHPAQDLPMGCRRPSEARDIYVHEANNGDEKE